MERKTFFFFYLIFLLFSANAQVKLVEWHSATQNLQATCGTHANINAFCDREVGYAGGFTYPAGANGVGDYSLSSLSWDNGNNSKYWLCPINTVDYQNLSLSCLIRSSATGPRDFKVQYAIGTPTTWIDVPSATILAATNWTSGVLNNLALPPACDNQSNVYLRWILTSNIAVNGAAILPVGTAEIEDVVISGAAINPVATTGLILNPTYIPMSVGGGPATITATITPAAATNPNLIWTSSNPAVAIVNNGVVTAIASGGATITATSVNGNFSATASLYISGAPIPVTGISVFPNVINTAVGGPFYQLKATFLPANATNKNVIWTSANTAIATVGINGTVTAVGVGTAIITATSMSGNYTATCTVNVGTPATLPVNTHPRLLITQADLPRLQSWATNTNQMYLQNVSNAMNATLGNSPMGGALYIYDHQFFPTALSAGLPNGNINPNAVPNPTWPDNGGINFPQYLTEEYALFFAFNSLIDPNPVARQQHAQRARNLLMYPINIIAQGGIVQDAPFQDIGMISYNRGNSSGEAWGLTVDWLQAAQTPVFTTQDFQNIRKVFLLWSNYLLTSGYHAPTPAGVQNSPIIFNGNETGATNNYMAGHTRSLTMMALCLDAAEDPADQPNVYNGVPYPNLRSYIHHVTGARLYELYAMYGKPANIAAAYKFNHPHFGYAEGGMGTEGFMYSNSLGQSMLTMLALRTAGYNDPLLAGPQIQFMQDKYWDDLIDSYYHNFSPKQRTFTGGLAYLGSAYEHANYSDVIYTFEGKWDHTNTWSYIAYYDYLTGNTSRYNKAMFLIEKMPAQGGLYGRYGAYGVWSNNLVMHCISSFLAADPAINVTTLPDPRPAMPVDFCSKGIRRVLSRSDWTQNASWFTFKASPAEVDHQEPDAGAFEFYRKGEWLTKYLCAYAINTPDYTNTLAIQNTVNAPGYSQPTNLSWIYPEIWARGGQMPFGGGGNPVCVNSFHKDYAYAQAVTTGSYNLVNIWTPSAAATDVTHASRSIMFLKPDMVFVYDRATTNHAGKFKRFHLFLNNNNISVSGKTATMTTATGQQLYVENILPTTAVTITPTAIEPSPLPHPGNGGLATGETATGRLAIEDPTMPANVRYLHVLQGADANVAQIPMMLVQSTSGNSFEGVYFQQSVVMFNKNITTPFVQTNYTTPLTIATHYITGVVPSAWYDVTGTVNGANLDITVIPGTTIQADTGGVIVYKYVSNPLAITGLNLEGYENGEKNTLHWDFDNHQSIAKMEMERKGNASNWQKIGDISVISNQENYAFDDTQPLKDAFYRLHIVEMNGEESVSNTVHLHREGISYPIISIFPNPCSDILTVKMFYGNNTSDFGEIVVSNLAGQVIEKIIPTAAETQIDVAKWTQGMYFLKIKDSEGKWLETVKVAKQ